MYEMNSVHGDDYALLGLALDENWEWLWEETPEEEVERAVKRMRYLEPRVLKARL